MEVDTMKKYILRSVLLVLFLVFAAAFLPLAGYAAGNFFNDVSGNHWARNAIELAVDQGYVSGYPDGTFQPNKEVTRAEFLRMLVDLVGIPHSQGATPWYQGYVAAALEFNIHVKSDFEEYVEPITRLEMSRLVARSLAMNEQYSDLLEAFAYLNHSNLPFSDLSTISESDVSYLALTYGAEVISGYPNGTFGPERTATRAEAVVMLQQMLSAMKKSPESFSRMKDLQAEAERNGAPVQGQVSLSRFLGEVLGAMGLNSGLDPVSEAKKAGIYSDSIQENEGVTRLQASRVLAQALSLEPSYKLYLSSFERLYNGDIPVLDWKSLEQKDVPAVALAFGALIFDRDEQDASFGFEKRVLESDLHKIMERFKEAKGKRPESFQYLLELKEVAETGTNAKTLTNLTVLKNLQESPIKVEHYAHSSTLKRVYVLPVDGSAVSMYERKFLWDRQSLNDDRLYSYVRRSNAIIIGVADAKFKIKNGDYGTNLMIGRSALLPSDAMDKFGLHYSSSLNYVPAVKGEEREVILTGIYNKNDHALVSLKLHNSLERFDGLLFKNEEFKMK